MCIAAAPAQCQQCQKKKNSHCCCCCLITCLLLRVPERRTMECFERLCGSTSQRRQLIILPRAYPFPFLSHSAPLSLSLSYVYVYVRAPAPSPSRSQVFFTYCHNTVPFSRLFHSFAVILGQHTFRTPRGFPAELGPIKKTLENTLSTLNTTQNTSHTFLGSLALR